MCCQNANRNNLTFFSNERHRYTILRPRSAGILLANRLSVHLQAFGTSRPTKTPPEKQKRGAGTGDEGERKTATAFVKSQKMSTFVPLTTLMRGERPATQGGFFCVPAKGASTYKRRPAFTEPVLTGITRASGVVSSGIVRAAFLFCTSANYTHHAHHIEAPALPGNQISRRTADYPPSQHSTRATHGRRHAATSSGVSAPNEADCDQNPVFRREVITPNSLIFRNLSCVFTR